MMKVAVIIFPGSNCDDDCVYVSNKFLTSETVQVWHEESNLPQVDLVILPGGFSYGDYLRTGAIANFSNIMKAVVQFAINGGLVLGICNGFQILLEVGLLKGAMLINENIHFICKDIFLKTCNFETAFSNKIAEDKILQIPIAHKEGNYFINDDELKELQNNNQIAFQYCNEAGELSLEANPNGSINNIAGIFNKEKNILGLMPHPERASENIIGSNDGKLIFDSVKYWIETRI